MGEGLVRRLGTGDRDLARDLFIMMTEVFEESPFPLENAYLDRLLSRPDFWVLAALEDGEVVGGLTAHTLPMTRSQSAEVLIYDLAVRTDHQRQGIGRQLVEMLWQLTQAEGIQTVMVLADNDDPHAVKFYQALGGEPSSTTFFVFSSKTRD